MTEMPTFKLSVCIPTFNRATYIGEALESIISQATGDCEIVVSDNASTDHTQEVVARYIQQFDRLRYIRQEKNSGCDRNFDCAVRSGRGEYCWLFSDDDVLKPGAIAVVLEAISLGYSLILVNGEHRDVTMSDVRIGSFFSISKDRVYASDDFDQLFIDVGPCSMCACCVVIRKDLWVARETERYYGSWFLHTAVIFQKRIPGSTLVIARPLMSLRLGNRQTAQENSFFVWYMSWPSLLWSFPLAKATKRIMWGPTPWVRLGYLLTLRATGRYSITEYKRWVRPRLKVLTDAIIPTLVALLPQRAANRLYGICSSAFGWPSSPYAHIGRMFPESLKVLRPDASKR